MRRSARTLPLVACLASVAVCLLYAGVRSQLTGWWRGHGGGVFYVLFWVLLWFTLLPKRRYALPICVACVLLTCCLELFQLVQGPPWLDEFRRTPLGAAWLGYGYDARDIPPYLIGGSVGWLLGFVLLSKPASRE